MKKLLITILAIVYLGTSSGVVLHMHYCMGKLAELGFSAKTSSICSKCGMPQSTKKKGCCKDESSFVKNTSDQKLDLNGFQFLQNFAIEEIHNLMETPTPLVKEIALILPISHAPPDPGGPAVYIRICSFLI
jgi:hypothetical protein